MYGTTPYQLNNIGSNFNQIYLQNQQKDMDKDKQLAQGDEKKEACPDIAIADSDDDIEEGDVDDVNHSRYKRIAKIIYGCSKMLMQPIRTERTGRGQRFEMFMQRFGYKYSVTSIRYSMQTIFIGIISSE